LNYAVHIYWTKKWNAYFYVSLFMIKYKHICIYILIHLPIVKISNYSVHLKIWFPNCTRRPCKRWTAVWRTHRAVATSCWVAPWRSLVTARLSVWKHWRSTTGRPSTCHNCQTRPPYETYASPQSDTNSCRNCHIVTARLCSSLLRHGILQQHFSYKMTTGFVKWILWLPVNFNFIDFRYAVFAVAWKTWEYP
jgi:hypothetical protein